MEYLKSVWAMLSPFREESLPLLSKTYHDVESCTHTNTDSIILVCEIPEVAAYYDHQHARVSPFSEYHFPLRPFNQAVDYQQTRSKHA
jgi:hypothetical protein